MARVKSGGFDLGGYVEVKDRILPFYERFPEGRIETEVIEITDTRVTVKALLYHARDAEIPIATGHSWMNVPGSTTYTKGSEIENTETSAVGRALAFIGIGIDKSIASKEEVEGKQSDGNDPITQAVDPNAPTPTQKKEIRNLAEALYGKDNWKRIFSDAKVDPATGLDRDSADQLILDLQNGVYNA